MMDIEVLNALGEIEYIANSEEINGLTSSTLKHAREVLMKKLSSPWIPVTERLPEWSRLSDNTYLVTIYHASYDFRSVRKLYFSQSGEWEDCPLGYEVIAWMPIPEPYKGG